jgi:hypothetical protein
VSTKDDNPKNFDDVVKPVEKPELADVNPIIAQSASFLQGRTKEWDKFLGQINDSYIEVLRKYAPKNEFTIDVNGENKTYTRKKIKAREYAALEKLRGQFTKEKDTEKAAEIQIEIYQKVANAYLSMTPEEFEEADYEELKKVCDACNFSTLHGIPN